MADFKPFDYAQATGAGTRNALATMQAQGMAQQLKDYPENRKNALAGMQIDRALKGFQWIEKSARMVNDQPSLDAFNQKAVQLGVAADGELPTQWNEQTSKTMNELAGRAKQNIEKFGPFERIEGLPDGVEMYGQKSLKSGKYANTKSKKELTGSDSGSGLGGLKAADENAIYKYAASQFDGLYDPVTGQFKGLKGTDKQDAQAIATVASRLFVQGGKTRHEAVTEAARMMGIKIRDLTKKGPKNPSFDDDPLGLR